MSKYLRVRPNGEEEIININTLAGLQHEVGGYLTTVPSPNLPDTVVWANDEGLLMGLERNDRACEITGYPHLVGTILIGGAEDEDGNVMDYEA